LATFRFSIATTIIHSILEITLCITFLASQWLFSSFFLYRCEIWWNTRGCWSIFSLHWI